MSPALSSRPIKGTVFLVCAAVHAAIVLMVAQAGLPGSGLHRNGITAESASNLLVPVKISPPSLQHRPDAQLASPSKKIVPRQRRPSLSSSKDAAKPALRPKRLAPQKTGAKTVTPILPLLANPLGQGSWGLAPPPPAPRSEISMASIQQERAAFRMALMDRLSVWMGRQMQEHRDSDCRIRLSQASRQAQLSCASRETESMLWPALSGLIIPGEPRPEDMICVATGNGHLEFTDCDRKQDMRDEK